MLSRSPAPAIMEAQRDVTQTLLQSKCSSQDNDHQGDFGNHASAGVTYKPARQRVRNLWLAIAFLLVICAVLFILVLVFALRPGQDVCMTHSCLKTASDLIRGINWTADPCEDFYSYACGGWEASNRIPDDEASVSNFKNLVNNMELILKDLVSEPATAKDTRPTNLTKQFFTQCLDTDAYQQESVWMKFLDNETCTTSERGWPVRGQCYKASDGSGLVRGEWQERGSEKIEQVYGNMLRRYYGFGPIFKMSVQNDDKNSSRYVLTIDEPDLALLHKQNYHHNENSTKAYKDLIHHAMAELIRLSRGDLRRAEEQADDIFNMEMTIVNSTQPDRERANPLKYYTLSNVTALRTHFPKIDWDVILKAMFPTHNFEVNSPIVVNCWKYLENLNQEWEDFGVRQKYNYVYWRWFKKFILPDLSGKLDEIYSEFERKTQGSGGKKRWKSCIKLLSDTLFDEAVGALYVEQKLTKDVEEKATTMVNNIVESFSTILDGQTWLNGETHDLAMGKAKNIQLDVLYPKHFKSDPSVLEDEYKDFELKENYFFTKVHFFATYQQQQLDRLYKLVDKEKWITGPATVNAFYSPNHNSIVIPAGIMQPVFYSRHYPESMNYGGIGVVIGHELTHGFDDKGRLYDKDGNLKKWWDEDTVRSFEDKAQCIADQYSSYKLHQINKTVNGNRTKGENIADNGGLKEAYYAYKKWEADNGKEPRLPGMEEVTHDQLFFINYARIWCGKYNDVELLQKLNAAHSPSKVRVIGPVSNSLEFSKAFGCEPKNGRRPAMNPEHKCSVW